MTTHGNKLSTEMMQTSTFDLAEFKRFVASKPGDERYHYIDDNCPFAQFLRSKGYRGVLVSPCQWLGFRWFVVPNWGRFPGSVDRAIAMNSTFGALLSRLDKIGEGL